MMIPPEKALNTPHFAPEYWYSNKKYYSTLDIIKEKGYLKLNRNLLDILNHPNFLFCPPNLLIDSEIKRINAFWSYKKVIDNPDTFVAAISKALVDDARAIENTFPDYTILALVGGMDSLNILLIPWKNPVVVASAEPNYTLVKDFMLTNGLNYDIIQLEDERNLNLEKEILINCCRLNLEHCRWTGHLEEIAKNYDGKIVILKGQWGDSLLTHKWKQRLYSTPDFLLMGLVKKTLRKIKNKTYKIWSPFPNRFRLQQRFFRKLWYNGAHWQGIHMAFLYEYIGVPVLSMYHNAHVMDVVTHTNYKKAVDKDLRMQIGEKLYGQVVTYPTTNPSPPVSMVRKNISGPQPFIELLQKMNIKII